VGGEDAVGVPGDQEGGEEFVADVAGGLFDGLGVAIGSGFGDAVGDVGLVEMEGDVEADAEVFDELLVGVGFRSAKAVMDVDGAEANAEGFAWCCVGGVEGEEKSYGISTAGDGDAEAVSGFDVGAVEGELGGHPLHVNCSLVRRRWVEFYTRSMFKTRLATVADAELIARQRRSMFVDSGQAEEDQVQTMMENFVVWVWPRLSDGSYVGWLVEEDERVVAGAGMWLIDFPPHWMDAEPIRAYLLNFYVDPAFRGRGLAYDLLKTAVEDARRRGIRVVSLHASKFGKPLYERNGFEATNEMILRLDDSQDR
jgi:GNAT superfamily N-acetyltransferase